MSMTLVQTIAVFFAKYVIFLLVFAAGLWLLLKVPRQEKKAVIIFGAICLPLIFIASLIAAKLYYDPRPFMAGNFTPLLAHSPGNGFPSDHTLLGAAIASVVWRFNRRFGAVLLATALTIGLSRVYVGVHHMADILGAILIATSITYFVNLVMKRVPYLQKL